MEQKQQMEELLESGKMNALRQMLIGLNNQELERLQLLMRDPHAFAHEISDLLPYAVRKLIEKGELSIDSLMPIVEDAMHKSVQKNPRKLADILFPVMGPAIRKAVSEDLKRMIASINTSIESGISPKSIKWRLQALFSKRSYTEIVLANTYIYHVSHVFLIHRKSGILLHQEVADESQNLESDMISAMLTAIRDFVQDSFQGNESASLENIQVGEMNIFIEQGPHAIIAAIVEGNPPADFRLTLTETIEAVHFNHAADLENFNGETKIFIHTSKFLKNCLIRERKTKKSAIPWPLIIIAVILLSLIGWLIYQSYSSNRDFNRLIEKVNNSDGYHVTSAKKKGKLYHIEVLRDIDSESMDSIIASGTIKSERIITHIEPFLSLDSSILIKRANKLLNPPATVAFAVDQDQLIVSGKADNTWKDFLNNNFFKIIGINRIDTSGLQTGNKDVPELDWIIPAIEQKVFVFGINIVTLNEQQQLEFDSLVQAALYLDDYNQINNKQLKIYVRSYTGKSGNVEANMSVAVRRAEAFARMLKEAGIKEELLEAQVKFIEETESNALLRSVKFEVFEKPAE